MKTFDQLDVKKTGKLSIDEFLKVAEPPFSTEGPNVPPLAERQARARAEFENLDTNKDGFLDKVELTAHAVKEFMQIDLNKDRFLNEEEFKKSQEAEAVKLRAIIQTMMPAQPAQATRPAPAQPRPALPPQQQAPSGLSPGLPQGTR